MKSDRLSEFSESQPLCPVRHDIIHCSFWTVNIICFPSFCCITSIVSLDFHRLSTCIHHNKTECVTYMIKVCMSKVTCQGQMQNLISEHTCNFHIFCLIFILFGAGVHHNQTMCWELTQVFMSKVTGQGQIYNSLGTFISGAYHSLFLNSGL